MAVGVIIFLYQDFDHIRHMSGFSAFAETDELYRIVGLFIIRLKPDFLTEQKDHLFLRKGFLDSI